MTGVKTRIFDPGTWKKSVARDDADSRQPIRRAAGLLARPAALFVFSVGTLRGVSRLPLVLVLVLSAEVLALERPGAGLHFLKEGNRGWVCRPLRLKDLRKRISTRGKWLLRHAAVTTPIARREWSAFSAPPVLDDPQQATGDDGRNAQEQ